MGNSGKDLIILSNLDVVVQMREVFVEILKSVNIHTYLRFPCMPRSIPAVLVSSGPSFSGHASTLPCLPTFSCGHLHYIGQIFQGDMEFPKSPLRLILSIVALSAHSRRFILLLSMAWISGSKVTEKGSK